MLLRLSCSFRNQCHDGLSFVILVSRRFAESPFTVRVTVTPYSEFSTTYLIGRHPSPESEVLSRLYSNLRFRSRLRRPRLHKKRSPRLSESRMSRANSKKTEHPFKNRPTTLPSQNLHQQGRTTKRQGPNIVETQTPPPISSTTEFT